MWSKGHWEGKGEEEEVGDLIDTVAPMYLRERTNQERAKSCRWEIVYERVAEFTGMAQANYQGPAHKD